MKNIKKYKKKMNNITYIFEPVSKILLSLGSAAAGVCYLFSCFLLIIWRFLFPDYDTALYWGGECICLAKEFLGAFFIPVLLFEIVLIAADKKN